MYLYTRGFIFKEEQKSDVEAVLSGKDDMAVLPTGFGKSIIFQSFVLAEAFGESHSFASIAIIIPLWSIIEDQLYSYDFGLKAVTLKKNQQLLKDIADNRFQLIFSSAERALPLVFEIYFTHMAKTRDIGFFQLSQSLCLIGHRQPKLNLCCRLRIIKVCLGKQRVCFKR